MIRTVTLRFTQVLAGLCLGALLSAAWVSQAANLAARLPPPAASPVDFAKDVRPILEKSCLECHGPEKAKGKFLLDSREHALKGGDNGVDIIPGDSAKSPLI